MRFEDDFLDDLGLKPVINAAGKLTVLGASRVANSVTRAMSLAAQRYIDLNALMAVAGERISEATGAEAGFVTSCSAAGITIATAACLTRGDRARTEQLPNLSAPPNEMIIQRGQAINFGAPVIQMMALAGAQVVEIGAANRTKAHQLTQAINEKSSGVMFVISHHAAHSDSISLEETVEIAHTHDLPVVVDAAAELDLRKYISAGADLVIYSGHKGLNAPTSGIIAGRRDLVEACRQQNEGIGRTMKIGKENIVGLLAALQHAATEIGAANDRLRAENLAQELSAIRGLQTEIVTDQTRPAIVRLRLILNSQETNLTAEELIAKMEGYTPSIRTRNHAVRRGIIDLDFRTLHSGDEQVIRNALRQFLN